MKALHVLTCILCSLTFTGEVLAKSDDGKVVVAKMDGHTITMDEYRLEFTMQLRYPPEAGPFQQRVDHLERMITRILAADEARAAGYTLDLDERQLERSRRRALVYELFRVYARPDTVRIPEDVLRRDYEMWNTQVRIRALMVEHPAEAEEILALLEQGEDFVELARSRGRGSEASLGGDLGWKSWAELELVPEIRETAYTMEVGDVSGVLKSEYGYHIIRLEDRQPNPQRSYEDLRWELLWRRRKPIMEQKMTNFRQAVEDSLDVRVSQSAAGLLVARVEGDDARRAPGVVADLLADPEKEIVLVTWISGRWTIGEFLDFLQFTEERLPKGGTDEMVQFVRKNTVNDLLVRVARDRGLEDTDGFRLRMRSYEETLLGSRYREAFILPKARVTTSLIESYYAEHKSDYITPEAVHLRMIVVETPEAADSVLSAVKAGADFEDLVRARTTVKGGGETGGDMGYVTRGRFGGLLDDIAFHLEPGELSEPFVWFGDWAVVQCLDRQLPRLLTLEEASPQISATLEPNLRVEANQAWERELREKYHVVLYPERLK